MLSRFILLLSAFLMLPTLANAELKVKIPLDTIGVNGSDTSGSGGGVETAPTGDSGYRSSVTDFMNSNFFLTTAAPGGTPRTFSDYAAWKDFFNNNPNEPVQIEIANSDTYSRGSQSFKAEWMDLLAPPFINNRAVWVNFKRTDADQFQFFDSITTYTSFRVRRSPLGRGETFAGLSNPDAFMSKILDGKEITFQGSAPSSFFTSNGGFPKAGHTIINLQNVNSLSLPNTSINGQNYHVIIANNNPLPDLKSFFKAGKYTRIEVFGNTVGESPTPSDPGFLEAITGRVGEIALYLTEPEGGYTSKIEASEWICDPDNRGHVNFLQPERSDLCVLSSNVWEQFALDNGLTVPGDGDGDGVPDWYNGINWASEGLTTLPGAPYPSNLTSGVIRLSGNSIPPSDLQKFSDFAGATLALRDMGLSDISFLSEFSGNTLYLARNDITDLNPLSGFSGQILELRSNDNLADISPLSGVDFSSGRLDLQATNVSDVSPLAGKTFGTLMLVDITATDLSPMETTQVTGQLDINDLTMNVDFETLLPSTAWLCQPANSDSWGSYASQAQLCDCTDSDGDGACD